MSLNRRMILEEILFKDMLMFCSLLPMTVILFFVKSSRAVCRIVNGKL